MAYSLYKYLLEEYDLTGYSPKRINDEEKEQILKFLKSKNKSPLAEFCEYLELYDGDRVIADGDVNYWITNEY
jgi:hypothetical protein